MRFRDRTLIAVQRQLLAMGEQDYDLGIGLEGGDLGAFICKKVQIRAFEDIVPFLRGKNAENYHIYVRPLQASGLVLLDDLGAGDEARLMDAGFEPAAWVETSPSNFQAWLRLSLEPMEPSLASALARYLAKAFGADPNSADWRHYGRLAGFTNRKSKYEKGGLFPFVLIHQWSGQLATAGKDLLQKIKAHPELDPVTQSHESRPVVAISKRRAGGETYKRFADRILQINRHKPWASDPDWSRMDWMIAKDMMQANFSEEAVREAIRQGSPNLHSRHAGPKRVENYVCHTVKKIFSGEY